MYNILVKLHEKVWLRSQNSLIQMSGERTTLRLNQNHRLTKEKKIERKQPIRDNVKL